MKDIKAYVRLPLAIGLVLVLGLAGLVVAQSQTKAGEKPEKQDPSMMMQGKKGMEGMQRGMMMNTEQMNKMMEHQMQMMKQSGMPEHEMMQWKSMMMADVTPDSPGGLLGFKDALNLTSDQLDQLKSIQKESAQKAMDVLTPEQKSQFEKMKYEPGNVMQLSLHARREAMSEMRGKWEEKSKEGMEKKEGWGEKSKQEMQKKEGWGEKSKEGSETK